MDDLDRKIAETLGWKWNAVCPYLDTEKEWLVQHETGCWSFIENGREVHGAHLPDFEKPAMTVMLLEKLPWPEVTRFKDLDGEGWMVVPHWDNPSLNAVATTIGRAVKLAFCKAHGLAAEGM